MTEIWKTIENYKTYSVSTFGNIRNDLTSKILKGRPNKFNHLRIQLYKDKKANSFYIHRLVALAFIPNPENKAQVDHIDNNPTNNNLTNLRWATSQENLRNSQIASNNTSGVKGVSWYNREQKWVSKIYINGVRFNLGYYNTIEEATIARQLKANEAFGSFTNSCELIKI